MARPTSVHYLPASVYVLIGKPKSPLGRASKSAWRARIGTVKTVEPIFTLNVLDVIDGYGEPDLDKIEANLTARGAESVHFKFV